MSYYPHRTMFHISTLFLFSSHFYVSIVKTVLHTYGIYELGYAVLCVEWHSNVFFFCVVRSHITLFYSLLILWHDKYKTKIAREQSAIDNFTLTEWMNECIQSIWTIRRRFKSVQIGKCQWWPLFLLLGCLLPHVIISVDIFPYAFQFLRSILGLAVCWFMRYIGVICR